MINISAERFGELLDAEARLAEVEALCDPAELWRYCDDHDCRVQRVVRAAARGEGDRG